MNETQAYSKNQAILHKSFYNINISSYDRFTSIFHFKILLQQCIIKAVYYFFSPFSKEIQEFDIIHRPSDIITCTAHKKKVKC